MRTTFGLLIALSFFGRAVAADLTVVIHDGTGRPVQDAVVTVHPASGGPHAAIKFPWPYQMTQEDIQFHPFVLIVPVGTDVEFPNHDNVRHHVYSFSATKRFELKLYGREQLRTVQFDKAGVVALGCNIHDRMIGFIDVVDTPYAAKSEATGVATVSGVPAGAATLTIWHPYLKGKDNELVRQIVLPPRGASQEAVIIDLRAAAPVRAMKM